MRGSGLSGREGRKALETIPSDNGDMSEVPTVLVVDDEPIVREVLSRYLASGGFAVETAEDGEQALERFEAADRKSVV